jgi:Bacterial PH domain
MIYPSKKDLWIIVLVLPVSLLQLGIGIFLISLVVAQAAPPFALIPALILSAVGGLLLWPVCSTYCEITSTDLVVHFGPLRVRIPLDAIAEVIPKTGYSAEAAWHLGWSLDRVVIKYRKRSGRVAWIGVAVSPADKEGFLEELAEALAELTFPGEEPDR